MSFDPYLMYRPQSCGEAFTRYQRDLRRRALTLLRMGDMPGNEQVPADQADLIIHAALNIDGRLLMGSDDPTGGYRRDGRSASTCITRPPTSRRPTRSTTALAEGGEAIAADDGDVLLPEVGHVQGPLRRALDGRRAATSELDRLRAGRSSGPCRCRRGARSSTKRTSFGALKWASRSRTHAIELVGATLSAPARSTTNARGTSPHRSSGTPTTATSSTAGMRGERLLDLDRRDVLAARDDEVLLAVDDREVAVRVDDVRGHRCAASRRERRGRSRRGGPSSRSSRGSTATTISPASRRPTAPRRRRRRRRAGRRRGSAARSCCGGGLTRGSPGLSSALVSCGPTLGHPVAADALAPEPALDLGEQRGRRRRAADRDLLHARQVAARRASDRSSSSGHHRRHQEQPRDPLGLDEPQHLGRRRSAAASRARRRGR